jgi:ribose transport system permease protein
MTALRTWLGGRKTAVWIATLALFALSAVFAPGTVSSQSIQSMLPFAAVLAIASIGQTLVVQQGGIDLSVPGIMSLAAVVVTQVPHGDDGQLILGILAALAVAALAGLLNGLVVTKLRVTAIVATLGVNALLLGAVRSYSGGVSTGAASALSDFSLAKTLGVSNTVLLAVAIAALVSVLVSRSLAGRRFVAVGAAPRAARVAGLRVERYVIGGYVLAGVCYGAAAIVLAGYVQTPSITTGDPYLLAPIAAVVIGGTALGRGKATIIGSAGGALFLSQLTQLILGLGAPTAVQLLVQAAVIGVAVGAQGVNFRRVRFRRRSSVPAAAAQT